MSIKVCLCCGNDKIGSYKGWKIRTKKETKKEKKEIVLKKNEEQEMENMALNKFAQGVFILTKTLERSEIETETLQNHIEISNIKIYDRNEKLNIGYVQKVIEWLKETDFHVVHLLTRSIYKQSQRSIVASMRSLQNQSVLVSPCVCTIRPPAPVDFPCQMAIAVGIQKSKGEGPLEEITDEKTLEEITVQEDGEEHIPLVKKNRDWQSCGSTLDFVCPRQYDGDITINNPWEASYYTTAITALILVKAYALGEYGLYSQKFHFATNTE